MNIINSLQQQKGDEKMKYQYNDGGRSEAGFKGTAGDCVVRAIAIATKTNYLEVYNTVNIMGKDERITRRKTRKSNARTGVYKQTYNKLLTKMGWKWTACMGIGTGCKVHLKEGELPKGRLIARLSKHITVVIDGVINDTFDPSRNGTRCVYGYWSK
jgi:hypothetical protein